MSVYDETKNLLRTMNLFVPLSTDDFIFRLSKRLHAEKELEFGEEDIPFFSSITLLRAAELCVTRNLNVPMRDERGFEYSVNVDVLDAQISTLTAMCTCMLNPFCSITKNHISYITLFSGEKERLRKVLGSERATDVYDKMRDGEELYHAVHKNDSFSEFMTPDILDPWLRMKTMIWYEIAKIIAQRKTFQREVSF
jgi:hypothetical protein